MFIQNTAGPFRKTGWNASKQSISITDCIATVYPVYPCPWHIHLHQNSDQSTHHELSHRHWKPQGSSSQHHPDTSNLQIPCWATKSWPLGSKKWENSTPLNEKKLPIYMGFQKQNTWTLPLNKNPVELSSVGLWERSSKSMTWQPTQSEGQSIRRSLRQSWTWFFFEQKDLNELLCCLGGLQ